MTKDKHTKKTMPPPPVEQLAPGERSPNRPRVRLTGDQGIALSRLLMRSPYYPETPKKRLTWEALVSKGFVKEREDGGFIFTEYGKEHMMGMHTPPAGRPTKLTGPWLALVNHYGGKQPFAKLVSCSENAITRWAIHGVKPLQVYADRVAQLAAEAKLTNPFEAMQ